MADKRFRVKQALSAGGVVYRDGPAGVEVLLVETHAGEWGLPKGTPDYGETLSQTACREVREETGLQVELEEKIGEIEYWFARPARRERLHKFVHFWLMRPTGGSLDDHDDEHVSVSWFRVDAALRQVTHDTSVEMIERAADLLAARRRADASPPRA